MLAHIARRTLVSAAVTLFGCSPPSPSAEEDAGPAGPAARGAALVGDRGCASCHQSSDPTSGALSGRTTAIVPGGAYPKNLTPDDETGLGRWSDAAIVRAIREGIDDEGAPLCGAMPRFGDVSDADGAAIVAYLRSLPPVRRAIPKSACDDDALPRDAGAGAAAGDDAGIAGHGAAPPPPDTGPPWPAPGEIAISEIMFDPSGAQPDGEWIELHSTCDAPRTLSGLTLVSSNGRTHVVAPATRLVLAPGAYALFIRSRDGAMAASVAGAASAYEYGAGGSSLSGVLLANGATGAIALRADTQTIASAPYGAWGLDRRGASIQLDPAYNGGAARDRWCIASAPWADGTDLGTPGAPSRCADAGAPRSDAGPPPRVTP